MVANAHPSSSSSGVDRTGMSRAPIAQAGEVDFALHTLGWKAFQDLALAIAAEVLHRPVQVFLPSKDGGRDGAFVGTWPGGADIPDAKSTIQCKFTGKAHATLKLADVCAELGKIASLSSRGLAHDYILLTNAGVSGEAEAAIIAAFEAAGAARARVLGREWLTAEIRARPRLRMMVPRLYGLGDLSQIIDARAYLQARYILSAMGDDLAAFVTTAAHRQSVEALRQHRFVLLLGDPASGKSTIGASLAVGALDDGAVGTVRISDGEGLERHWNPAEPNQFFWIDDAFGETQYQRARVDGWNARLKMVRAAVKAGARVLMTSRTYIWNAAQRDLKLSEFPLLTNSQVIIDVQGLSDLERAQILYNHLRLGDQPSHLRAKLKPFLPSIATNPDFLPETARRLGSSFFTGELALTAEGIRDFFERPLAFLKDVLRGLAEPERAAIALIFLHGPAGVPSPISASDAIDTVCRLTGVALADVGRAMEVLAGSLTLLVEAPQGQRWTFKHPTVADAFAELVADSPEMVELYVRGAKLEKLLAEVVCGQVRLVGASVRVPQIHYDTLLDRMEEKDMAQRDLLRFAAYRSDREFLGRYVARTGDLNTVAQRISSDMLFNTELDFITKVHQAGLLPEPVRLAAVARISELCLCWADAEPFREERVRALFVDDEFANLAKRFRSDIVEEFGREPAEWNDRLITGDRKRHMRDLKDAIETFAQFYSDDDELTAEAAAAANAIEEFLDGLEEEEDETTDASTPVALKLSPTDQLATIFDDVDDE
jgi:hypothetical protein